MTIRETLIKWLTPKEKANNSQADIISALYSMQGMEGFSPAYTYRELVNRYSSWVFISVDKIAKTVAGAPKRFYAYKEKKSGKYIPSTEYKSVLRSLDGKDRYVYLKEISKTVERVEITDHPLINLFNKPNHIDVPFVFWFEIMSKLELTGACGIYKVKSGRLGIPMELWVLPTTESGEFKPIPHEKQVISGYFYSDGDIHQQFKLDEAVWIHYPNPRNKFEGMSALRAQLDPYSIDYYLMSQQKNFFKNNAFPGMELTTDQVLKGKQLDDLKADIKAAYEGVKNSGKSLILHSGLKSANLNRPVTRDLMIQELNDIVKDKFFAAYGMNEGMVGLTANQNKANLDTSRENFYIEAMKPRTILLCQEIEQGIVADFDDRIEFDIELPRIEQRELDITERQANLNTMTTTINEERTKMKLEKVEWGDRPFVPFNLMPYGSAPSKPGGSGEEAPSAEEEEGADKSIMTKEYNEAQWKAFDAAAHEHEPLFSKIMAAIFREQKAEVVDNLERDGVKIKSNIAGMYRPKLREWLSEHKDKTDKINIDADKWEKETAKRLLPAFKQTLIDAGQNRINQFSGKKAQVVEFNVDETKLAKWIGTKLRKVSKEITGTTFDDVEKKLKAGFEEGLPLAKIADELRHTFDVAETYRADLIARTESARTWNKGDLEGVRQMNLDEKLLKFWINEPDARETHQQAGKDYEEGIPIDEPFKVGDDVMDVPGDGKIAGENVNCRCTLGYKKAE